MRRVLVRALDRSESHEVVAQFSGSRHSRGVVAVGQWFVFDQSTVVRDVGTWLLFIGFCLALAPARLFFYWQANEERNRSALARMRKVMRIGWPLMAIGGLLLLVGTQVLGQ